MFARISVKKPYTVIVGILLVIALGAISFMNMTTDLLPSMDLPYVIAYTTCVGYTPERVENDVSRPLEAAFSTLTDVKGVSSTSSENLSVVVLEFEAGADMNTAMIEINSQIEQVSGDWDDAIGTPVIMKLNPDMLPVTIATVSMDDADLLELSDFVEDELVGRYEGVDGVARVSPSGVLTQQVDIIIEQERIDVLNNAILREVDAELADVELELRDAQYQISQGKSQVARARQAVTVQVDEALAAIDAGTQQLPTIIAGLTQQREQLVVQLDGAKQVLAQLEALVNLTPAEKEQIEQVADGLSALETRRGQLQEQLDALGGESTGALEIQLQDARKARDEQVALRDSHVRYVEDLKLLDADSLRETIAGLEEQIEANEQELSGVRGELETKIEERDAVQRELDDLDMRIATLEDAQATPVADPAATPGSGNNTDPTATPGSGDNTDPTATPGSGENTDPTATPGSEGNTDPTATPGSGENTDPTAVPGEGGDNDTGSGEQGGEPGAQGAPDPAPANMDEGEGSGEPVQPDAGSGSEPAQQSEPAPASQDGGVGTVIADALLGGSASAEGETLEELKQQRADAQQRLDVLQGEVDELSKRHDGLRETLNGQYKALDQAKETLGIIEEGGITVQTRIEAAEREIENCDKRIAELDKEIAGLTEAIDKEDERMALVAEIAEVDRQIDEIKESDAYKTYLLVSDDEGLNTQYGQAQMAVSQLEEAIAGIDDMLAKLNQGILPGGLIPGIDEDTNLADAREEILRARDEANYGFSVAFGELNRAEDAVAEAWKEFTDARDEALENAGIDGIITVETVSAILGSQNLELPAGYVANGEDRYLVSVGGEFASLEELKQVKLFSLGLESVDDVRLLDVANVEISDNSADLFTLVNGENGIMISFEKQSIASTAEVAENITAESDKLMQEYPRLHVTEMMNQGDYINLIVSSVLDNLVSGGILAVLILLLFLMDWRPTLIVAVSIPASVVVAFVCMYFSGITLNVMSLSGLAIGIGMLVDNSIVAIENIYRMREEEGLPILTACIRGVNQVGGALLASTLTTICVFLPVVFVEGMARDLFTDMGLTIAFSLLASLLVSMTVVPSFSAGLLRKSKTKKHRIFGAIQRAYSAMLRGALKVKILVLLVAVALLGYTLYEAKDMPISFMPAVNSEQMSASLTFENPDMPDSEREAIAISIMEGIMGVEGVRDVSLSAGDSMSLMSMGGGGDFTYYILVEPGVRTNSEIADDMKAAAAPWADGEAVVFGVQVSTMDLSAFAGQGITINIVGDDFDDMRRAAVEIAAICAQVPGAVNIDDGAESAEPKLVVTVDKELASDNSLSVAQVYQYIATRLYGPVELTSATLDGREYTIYVSEDRNENLSTEDIADMEIEVQGTNETRFVRIGDIAHISYGESFSSIQRSNQQRTTSVSFQIDEGYSANLVSRDLEERLAGYVPPEGCEISLAGENESVMGYMSDLGLMLLVAVLFIFLIMVAQFQSFKSPFIVMFTIPLAFTGGLLALMITKMDLSIIAMVGFLVLSGVVVNNGIVFVDSVNQMRIGGMSKREALVETGRIRLRPILMTALTTILGMSTMAFAQGMGAEMMQPMAVVIVGGLIYSTLMTLFLVPVLYDIFNGEKMKAREIEMMKEAAGLKREGFDFDESPAAVPAPVKHAPETEIVEDAPAKPAPETEIVEDAPAKPAPETEIVEDAPVKPAPETEIVEDAPAKPAPETEIVEDVPVKPVPAKARRVRIRL